MNYFATTRPRAYSKPTREELKQLNYHLAQRSEYELIRICQVAAAESPEVAHVLMKVMRETNLLPASHQFQPVQNQPSIFCDRFANVADNSTGLATPPEMSEDSEMGGIENEAPQNGSQFRSPVPSLSTSFNNTVNYSSTESTSLQRPQQPAALATSFSRLHPSNSISIAPSSAPLAGSFSSSHPDTPNFVDSMYHQTFLPIPTTSAQTIFSSNSNKRKFLADRDDNIPTFSLAAKKRCTTAY